MVWLTRLQFIIGTLFLISSTGCIAAAENSQLQANIKEQDESAIAKIKTEETMPKQYLGQQYTHLNIHDAYLPYPELVAPVRAIMSQNQLPGHDTEAIYFQMNDDETTVTVTFIFAEGFIHPSYGPQARERILICNRIAGGDWSCTEQ